MKPLTIPIRAEELKAEMLIYSLMSKVYFKVKEVRTTTNEVDVLCEALNDFEPISRLIFNKFDEVRIVDLTQMRDDLTQKLNTLSEAINFMGGIEAFDEKDADSIHSIIASAHSLLKITGLEVEY